jgi:hypothetical protein
VDAEWEITFVNTVNICFPNKITLNFHIPVTILPSLHFLRVMTEHYILSCMFKEFRVSDKIQIVKRKWE